MKTHTHIQETKKINAINKIRPLFNIPQYTTLFSLKNIYIQWQQHLYGIFMRYAVIGIKRIYSTYGNIHSVPELRVETCY